MIYRFRNIFFVLTLSYLQFLQNNVFAQEIAFKHLTVENGLSNNKVNCLLEDRLGFIWFGTEDGLNRFDGYDIKIFRHQTNDKNSISGNSIWAMFEDKDGYVWIGTKSGEINRYDPKIDKFESWKVKSKNNNENSVTSIYRDRKGKLWIGTYKDGLYQFDLKEKKFLNWQYQPNNVNSLSNNYVTSILEDYKGNIWVSTYNGLNKFNPSTSKNSFTRFYHKPQEVSSISNNLIWNLFSSEIDANKFWIGTANGLSFCNSKTNTFSRFEFPVDKKLQFSNSVATIIEEQTEEQKGYWIGTYGGLIKINSLNNGNKRFISEENNPLSLTSNQINAMVKDRSGVIWIATENGVNYFSQKEVRFNNYLSQMGNKNSFDKLRKNNITSLCNSNNESICVGTREGLSVINNINQTSKLNSTIKFPNINVWSLYKGNSNNIWIGTYGDGLKEVDLKTNSLKSIEIKSDIVMPSSFLYIKSLLQDKSGALWIGCWGSGLVRYNPSQNEFKSWINDENDFHSLSYNDVWVIYEDKQGKIWIGTNGGGLNLFDPNNEKFFRLFSSSKNKNGLSSNSIYSIYESTNSKLTSDNKTTLLWIGTSNGLNKVSINNFDFINEAGEIKAEVKFYTIENGLPDNSIKSIVEDEKGNLWLGTSNGLSQFNPETEKFINYSIADGLNGNDFNFGAAYKSKKSLLVFGGTNGLSIFNPSEIKQSLYKPPIVITDFQIFNKSVSIDPDSPLQTNITLTDEIILPYDQNIFSFQFSALDYNSPSSNRYAYKMEGFDNDWIITGTRRYAAYTNLSPGTYNFKVKATNSDGVWNDSVKTIIVIINPPWWKTGWAYSLYLLIIFFGLVGIRRFELNRTKLRNELKMREFESQKLREIENMKSRFFANLSHEFRTPLMLIKGPLEQLKDGHVKGDPQNYYDLIYRNTENLHILIDQLLELTQLEVEAIPIRARNENLITLLRGIFYSFNSIAEPKHISLDFISNDASVCAWVDRDKLEKIINNLLSNAIKFTPAGGIISLTVKCIKSGSDDFAEIKISDTGIGIPEDKLDRIFDRFYQVDDSLGRAYGGSGIGLSLVKELVDLHKWEIDIKSEIDKGTTFIITIPLTDSYLKDKQKIKGEINPIKISSEQKKVVEYQIGATVLNDLVENQKISDDQQMLSEELKNKIPSILIVEDSSDVREYIFSLLKNDYNIIQAENAEDGIKKASDLMPDLILSDVMMPGMDGMEFCKQIKTNFQTSHIPVILLTAKVSHESKIEGLETGADDYVTKPFNFQELSVRIKNLLEQRKRLKEKFSKEIKIQPEAVTVNSVDKDFLERALTAAEKNLYNLDFDLETFAKEMFLSRSQLHRKMIAITGQAPGEFVRIFRLKKAAQLLLEKKLSVTQIALEVGFNSPSHFTKAFQQYFNCLPSVFVVQNNLK